MKLCKSATCLMVIISFLPAQLEKVEHKPNPTKMVDFGDLAEGPYQKLVIRNVMVIPGHGGPANGPFDILVTGNVIAKIQRHDPKKPDKMKGDRIIEGDNLFIMPGMLNLHLHLRNESLPLDYIFYLQLATGVTSIGPAEEKRVQKILEAERNNEVISPLLFPLYGWGSKTDFDEVFIMDPANADKVAKKMIKNSFPSSPGTIWSCPRCRASEISEPLGAPWEISGRNTSNTPAIPSGARTFES